MASPSRPSIRSVDYRFQPAPPAVHRSQERSGWFYPALIILWAGLLLIPNVQNTSNPGQGDEVMHIATVHDSLDSGSILYPELNGFINFYKPPLMFWLASGFEELSGWIGLEEGLLGERFVSILSSAVAGLLIYQILILYRRAPREAFFWSILYLSTLGVLKFARLLMFEQIMAAHVLGAMYVFALWLNRGGSARLLLLGLLVGSSYLYKGALVPIYLVLGLAVWTVMEFHRTGRRFTLDLNTKAALPVIRSGFIVGLAAAIPIALYAIYVMNHPRGQDLLNYFLVFENAAKFVDKNQSEWLLFQGILLYALPWTPLLLASLYGLFRRPGLKTPARQFAILATVAFVAILLFHLIPHRKADYYMLPLFGLLFVAAGLSRPSGIKSTNALVLTLSILSGLALAYMESWLALLAMLIPASLALHALVKRPDFDWGGLLPGLAFAALLPVTVFPALFPPVLGNADRAMLAGRSVCVISENPWSALSYRAVVSDAKMIHRHPDLAGECAGQDYIIEHDPTSDIPRSYSLVSTYPVWKEADFSTYLNNILEPEKIQRRRSLYVNAP